MKLTWDVEAQTQLIPSLMKVFEDVSAHFSRNHSDHQEKPERRLHPLSDIML